MTRRRLTLIDGQSATVASAVTDCPSTVDRLSVSVAEAAQILQTTPDAIRAKLRRGTLPGHRDSKGRWLVDLPTTVDRPSTTVGDGRPTADEPPPTADRPSSTDAALVDQLRSEVAFLRSQLQARDEEIRRTHVLAQQMVQLTDRRPWWRWLFLRPPDTR